MSRDWPDVRYVLRELLKRDFKITAIDDGGEDGFEEDDYDVKKALDAINAVDESFVRVEKEGKSYVMHFVLGNSVGESLCNWTSQDEIDVVAEQCYEKYLG
jgi:Zn-dependent M32 family carboxypeptidase